MRTRSDIKQRTTPTDVAARSAAREPTLAAVGLQKASRAAAAVRMDKKPSVHMDMTQVEIRPVAYLGQGQFGIYAKTVLEKGQTVGWYMGKIYEGERAMRQFEGEMQDSHAYCMAVEHPKTEELLYVMDGRSPLVPGGDLCDARLVNHARHRNCHFVTLARACCHKGYGIAVKTIQKIFPGEELLAFYGDTYHQWLVDTHGLDAISEVEIYQKEEGAAARLAYKQGAGTKRKRNLSPAVDARLALPKRAKTPMTPELPPALSRLGCDMLKPPGDEAQDERHGSVQSDRSDATRVSAGLAISESVAPIRMSADDNEAHARQHAALRIRRLAVAGREPQILDILRKSKGADVEACRYLIGEAIEALMLRDAMATPFAGALLQILNAVVSEFREDVVSSLHDGELLSLGLRLGSQSVTSALLALGAPRMTATDVEDLLKDVVAQTRAPVLLMLLARLAPTHFETLTRPFMLTLFYGEGSRAGARALARVVGQERLQHAIDAQFPAEDAQDMGRWYRDACSATGTRADTLERQIELVHAAGVANKTVLQALGSKTPAALHQIMGNLSDIIVRAAQYGRHDLLMALASDPRIGEQACSASMTPYALECALLGAMESGNAGALRQVAEFAKKEEDAELVQYCFRHLPEAGASG